MSDQISTITVESSPAESVLKSEAGETNNDNNNNNNEEVLLIDFNSDTITSNEGQGHRSEPEVDLLTLTFGDNSMARNKTGTCSPIMSDSSVSPVTTPRKLPSPHSSANANSGLKGVLIKPKRILPAQPDSPKGKRTSADFGGLVYKTDEPSSEVGQSATNTRKTVTELGCFGGSDKTESNETVKKITLPKLQIDVDRLKLYFRKQGPEPSKGSGSSLELNGVSNSQKDGESVESSETSPEDKSEKLGSHSAGVTGSSTGPPYLPRYIALYNHTPDGVAKVREWCAVKDTGNMSDPCGVVKAIERSIRSPSPRSNTTWDRSSSGYSSDERADPRSPPPVHPVTSGTEKKETPTATADDGISMTTENAILDICVTPTESDISINDENGDLKDDLIDFSDSTNNVRTEEVENLSAKPNGVVSDTTKDTQGKCETIVQNTVKPMPDSAVSARLSPRRPGWPLTLSNQPTSGRIQYRKSGSESLISLRYPSRQGFSDNNNFDGLEVCGKSYPQTPTPGAVRVDCVTCDSDKNDVTVERLEVSSPVSAFALIEKLEKTQINEKGVEVTKSDNIVPESPRRLPKTKFMPNIRHHLDNKKLTMGINALKDDKDIRKSLHELSSPRPAGKIVPIRARHPINLGTNNLNQPMGTFEAISGQPLNSGTANSKQQTTFDRPGTKSHGKKMWRAPSGQPENATSRPFSPFGGTLPPSKIKEQEHQRNHSSM